MVLFDVVVTHRWYFQMTAHSNAIKLKFDLALPCTVRKLIRDIYFRFISIVDL